MQYLPDVGDFVSKNALEIKKLVQGVCYHYKIDEVDDILQDFYTALISKDVLSKFDPNHPSKTKISTYLYRNIKNIIRAHNKSNEGRVEKHCIRGYNALYKEDHRDICDTAKIDVDYETVINRNQSSDRIDGVNFDLDLFETFLKKSDKFYHLKKRKNQVLEVKGLTLSEVFSLMRRGINHRVISETFGVSNMFISNLKNEIRDRMEKFGIVWCEFQSKQKVKKARGRPRKISL